MKQTTQTKLISILPALLKSRLIKNIGWIGSAQFLGRIIRLATTIVVARILTPEIYGQAAVVLTLYELIHVLTRRCTSAKLIHAPDDQIKELVDTAHWLNWGVCILACLLMLILAWPVSVLFGDESLLYPLLFMSVGFLLFPVGMIHAACNMRNNNLRVVAKAEMLQFMADGILTMVMVLAGWGIWALVVPKVLLIPVWIMVHKKASHWQTPKALQFSQWKAIYQYGRNVVGTDLLITLRNNIDYLLIGYFIGLEALGIYYFAYNAGLGISMSIINAYGTAIFPHLCEANTNPEKMQQRYIEGIKTVLLIAVPIIMLQSVLAYWYVPIIYGDKWLDAGAIPVLIILCLSALVRPLATAGSELLFAAGKANTEFRWNIGFTLILIIALLLSMNAGITGVAVAVLLVHLFLLPSYAVWAHKTVFTNKQKFLSTPIYERG